MSLPTLSVVVLCHDELLNLPSTLEALESVLVEEFTSPQDCEIVVVDDGSHDGTGAWLAAHPGRVPRRVVRHEVRRGYGRAVRSGLKAARGQEIAYFDGDGQFDARDLCSMRQTMRAGGYDIVAGIRVDRDDPMHRRVIGAMYNGVVRLATRVTLRDVDCGFKLLRRRVVDELRFECDGNLFGAELLVKAVRRGFRVHQQPVRHRARQHGRPKGTDLFAIKGSVAELLAHWREFV